MALKKAASGLGTTLGYKVPPLCQASILGLLPDFWTPRQVGWRLFKSQANQVLSLLALENPPYVKKQPPPTYLEFPLLTCDGALSHKVNLASCCLVKLILTTHMERKDETI